MSNNEIMEKVENGKRTKLILQIIAVVIGLGLVTFAFLVANDMYTLTWDFFGPNTDVIVSLISAVLGVLVLFIAFWKELDNVFEKAENKKIKLPGEEGKSITIDSLFSLIISIILLVLAVLMSMNIFVIRIEIFGSATRVIIIIGLILLGLLSFVNAFWATFKQSVNEVKKVTWPNEKQMLEYSKKVFVFLIILSLYFVALDLIIGAVKNNF